VFLGCGLQLSFRGLGVDERPQGQYRWTTKNRIDREDDLDGEKDNEAPDFRLHL
jgi:hypothetical protein